MTYHQRSDAPAPGIAALVARKEAELRDRVAAHFHVRYTYGSRTVIRDRVGCEMDHCECHYQDGDGIEPQNVAHVEALLAGRGCAWCGCGWRVQEQNEGGCRD